MSESETFVRVDIHDGVGTITLDRPDRLNAMGNTMDRQFWDALESLYADDSVRVVLWRAEGSSFSSGRDINDLGVRDGETDWQYISAGLARTRELLLPSPIPIVVAIQGWCIGGSFERTLLCDLRVAADDARFRLPELGHGLLPDSGGTARLHQMCGHGVVADLVLTGRVMAADEALRHGVVSRVVPAGDLDAIGRDIAETIAALPPLAVRMHRQVLQRLGGDEVAASLREEMLAQMLVYQSDDYAELKAARTDDRPPEFRNT
jgi:enoyl-CoA hydratase/carnithine racemase